MSTNADDVIARWVMEDRIVADDEYGGLETRPDYDDFVASFGEVEMQVRLGTYQGDTVSLLRAPGGERWAILTFGWGSCSGCDALEGAHTVADLKKLWDGMNDGLVWRTREEMQAHLREHDFAEDYWGHGADARVFIDKLMKHFDVDPEQTATRWEED